MNGEEAEKEVEKIVEAETKVTANQEKIKI